MRNRIVDIGGVPVEERTARFYERMGVLDPGMVDNAPVSQGWSLDP